MSTISKFGHSENTSGGIVGPRGLTGPAGAKGRDKGEQGEQGPPGADAVFPLALNYADISGVSSLRGPPDANSTMYINSNVDFNGSNSIYNVKNISGYQAIGQSITCESRMILQRGVEIYNDILNYSLTTNKFLKADNNKIITSSDITINDVANLSTRLTQNESKIASISLTSSGSLFTAPNQGASLIPSSSANPAFKIKGLTSSNNILLMISTDSVDITIDPLLTGRIDVLDSNFLNGLLIPSSISPGLNGQVLSSDGKNTVWKTPATTLQIPFKMFYGPNLDPPLVTDSRITLMNPNSFSGSSVFPIGFFQHGQIIKIKFTGSIISGATGSNTWSVYFNNTISFSYTHPTITTGGNLSAFTCEITCPIAISSGTNINIYNTTAQYMQGKNGESPQQPQCMTALAVGSGTSNLITNDLNVRFRQSVPTNNILNIYNVIYEVY